MDDDNNGTTARTVWHPENCMTGRRISLRELLIAPIVWVNFALLVFPLAISVIDSRLFSSLAVPGYILFVLMTVAGNILPKIRNFGFRLYWIPFLVVCYGISIAVGASYYAARRQYNI